MAEGKDKPAVIISLEAENFKRLRAVRVKPDPDGGLVIISGRNGQGKSSLLDAIMAVLGGTKAVPPKPIREGEEKAEVTVVLDTPAGDLLVRRTFTQKGSYLKVDDAHGNTFKSAQSVLDAFLGHLTFDPLAFTRMTAKEQRAVLLGVVDVGLDLDANAADQQKAYDERTEVNREIKRLEGKADIKPPAGFESWEDVPTAEIPIGDMIAKLDAARDVRQSNSERRGELRDSNLECGRLAQEISRLKVELGQARQDLEAEQAGRNALQADCEALVDPDVEAIHQELADLDSRNQAAHAKAQLAAIVGDLKVRRGDADTLTKRIERLAADRTRALREAQFPVEGLTVGVEGVLYNGLPLEQAAQSEQLKVSTAIAMALNPKLHVLRIQDGSLLDAESMAELAATAQEHDYQIWIERVADGEGVGIVIEDGAVVSNT